MESFQLMLHPGDLGLWELIGTLLLVLGLTVLPLVIIGLLIYKVIKRH
jgi:hypothetical protein